jgi:hypothetical protein
LSIEFSFIKGFGKPSAGEIWRPCGVAEGGEPLVVDRFFGARLQESAESV